MRYVIYAASPLACVLGEGQPPNPALAYAAHRKDWLNLGIAAVGYGQGIIEDLPDYPNDFTEGVLVWSDPGTPAKVARLLRSADVVVGFNHYNHTDLLLQSNGVGVTTQYDLLGELLNQAEVERQEEVPSGYSLEAIARANGVAYRPVDSPALWQQGQVEAVKDHCLATVRAIHKLLVLGLEGKLNDPVTGKAVCLPSMQTVLRELAC